MLAFLIIVFMMWSANEADPVLDQSEQVEAIRDLTAAVSNLSDRSMDSATSEPRRASLPRTPRQSDSSALVAAVDRLTKVIEQRMARSPNKSSASAGGVVRDSMASPKLAAENRAEFVSQDEATIRSQHQLWSLKQLVGVYGNPTSMSTGQSGELFVEYNDEATGVRVQFGFHDGIVVYVDKRQKRR